MKISVLEPLGIPNQDLVDAIAGALEAAGIQDAEIVTHEDRAEDAESLIARSGDADAVVLSNIPYPAQVMEANPNLKYVCVAFTGFDHVDMEYCRNRGIQVSNCAGYSTSAVADLVFGLVISLLRNIPQCDEAVRAQGTKAGLVGPELEGKKFGIIGAGAIGLRVARIAQAFGCQVYAYSRTPKQVEGVSFVSLEELLSSCDIVSLHVPQNASTVGLINQERLALMKPSAILINTARGPIVDSDALAAALNSGKLAGAGIDVFEVEPPVAADHPLLTAKNVIATPHVGFATVQAFQKRAVIVANNLAGFFGGNPINLV